MKNIEKDYEFVNDCIQNFEKNCTDLFIDFSLKNNIKRENLFSMIDDFLLQTKDTFIKVKNKSTDLMFTNFLDETYKIIFTSINKMHNIECNFIENLSHRRISRESNFSSYTFLLERIYFNIKNIDCFSKTYVCDCLDLIEKNKIIVEINYLERPKNIISKLKLLISKKNKISLSRFRLVDDFFN